MYTVSKYIHIQYIYIQIHIHTHTLKCIMASGSETMRRPVMSAASCLAPGGTISMTARSGGVQRRTLHLTRFVSYLYHWC